MMVIICRLIVVFPGNCCKDKRKNRDWMLIKLFACCFFVGDFGRLIKLSFSQNFLFFFLSLVGNCTQKLFRLKRVHKKSNLSEKKVTSTWEARLDFKRRRGKKRKFPSLFFLFSLQLNHHLASNWKKVKSKNKIIVTRKQRRREKKREIALKSTKKSGGGFFSCLQVVCRPSWQLKAPSIN